MESGDATGASQVARGERYPLLSTEPELADMQAGDGTMAVGSMAMAMEGPPAVDAATAERYRRTEKRLLEGPDADTYKALGNIVRNLQVVLKDLEDFINE